VHSTNDEEKYIFLEARRNRMLSGTWTDSESSDCHFSITTLLLCQAVSAING
jgi:hypothetical protein